MLILGQGALARPDGAAILDLARTLAEATGMVREDWNGFNVLHRAASRVGGLDLGFVPGPGGRDVAGILAGCATGEIDALYLLGADEIDTDALGSAFVIYQGHHGDRGARRADVVLPGAAYTEKDATYVNTEGRVQRASRAVFPPGDAREDWKILRALSAVLGQPLPYDSLPALRARMAEANASFAHPDQVTRRPLGRVRARRAPSSARRSSIRSPISTAPMRSAAPRRPWRNAPRHWAASTGAAKTGTHG